MKHLIIILLSLLPLLASAAVHPANVRRMSADCKFLRISELAPDQTAMGTFTYNADAAILSFRYADESEWETSPELIAVLRRILQGRYQKNNSDFAVREDGATLILTPKKKNLKSLYREIRVRFHPFTGYLQEVTLLEAIGTEPTDPRGDTIIIEFRNVEATAQE